jgi:hypothetical protein
MDRFEVFGPAAPERELFYWTRERSGRDVTTFRAVPGVTSLRVPPVGRLRGRPDDCPGRDDGGAAGGWPARPKRRPGAAPAPEPEPERDVPAEKRGRPAPARPSSRKTRRGTSENP